MIPLEVQVPTTSNTITNIDVITASGVDVDISPHRSATAREHISITSPQSMRRVSETIARYEFIEVCI